MSLASPTLSQEDLQDLQHTPNAAEAYFFHDPDTQEVRNNSPAENLPDTLLGTIWNACEACRFFYITIQKNSRPPYVIYVTPK